MIKTLLVFASVGAAYASTFTVGTLSPTFAYGSNLCTNAGGTIITPTSSPTGVPSPLVVPGDCLPSPKTNQAECQAINVLWQTKFNYCCPFATVYTNTPSGSGFYPQLKKNDPKALSPFPALLATPLGVTQPVKWGGHNVGCHVFYDCASYTTKATCKAAGTICVWQKNVHPSSVVCSQAPFGVQIRFEDGSVDTFLDFNPKAVDEDATFVVAKAEHLCVFRGNLLDGKVVGMQFQTSYGRRSCWYGAIGTGTRFERAPDTGQQIVGVSHAGIKTSRIPPQETASSLRSLVMSSSVRALVLQRAKTTKKSLVGQSLAGGARSVVYQGMRSGLATRLMRKDSDGHSLLRLVLDGEKDADKVDVPQSLLRALAERPSNFDHSLMDLLFAGKDPHRPPLVRLFFQGGKSSPASIVFAHRKDGQPSLAQLLFSQDRVRGLRSVLQLVTDDEVLDDPDNPSVLRMMLQGEEDENRYSVLRLVITRFQETSLMDELLKDDEVGQGCITRRLITETETQRALLRDFLTDTPSGKPALGRFVLGGESPDSDVCSLVRLMVQGEARKQASLLRLMVSRKNPKQPTVLSLLTTGKPSVLDIVMKGEESAQENSLARIVLGTTIIIENGQIRLGGALGDDPGGLTLAKASMAGEEDGGPGISILRMLLIGEDTTGLCVLRLLLWGEDRGEVSPLRLIFTGFQGAFVAAKMAQESDKSQSWIDTAKQMLQAVQATVEESHHQGSTWKDSFDKLVTALKDVAMNRSSVWIGFLRTAARQISQKGPEFTRMWKSVWTAVGNEIRLSGERVLPTSNWKLLAPECAVLTEHVAAQDWQKALVQVAVILSALESRNRSWMGKFSKWVPAFS